MPALSITRHARYGERLEHLDPSTPACLDGSRIEREHVVEAFGANAGRQHPTGGLHTIVPLQAVCVSAVVRMGAPAQPGQRISRPLARPL